MSQLEREMPEETERLFRAEVLDGRTSSMIGSIVLRNPLSHTTVSAIFVLMSLAIVLFVSLGSYSRKVEVPGVILPAGGLNVVLALQSGTIVDVAVTEGQSVILDQQMFTLNSERFNRANGETGAVISELLNQRASSLNDEAIRLKTELKLRTASAHSRIADLQALLSSIQEQINLQEQTISVSKSVEARYAELRDTFNVSAVQLEERHMESLSQQARLKDLMRASTSAKIDLENAESSLQDLKIQEERQEQSVQREANQIQEQHAENEAKLQLQIRAPASGTVSAMTIGKGQSVVSGQQLATIIPVGSELEAELYVPSRAAGFIRLGMQILIRYESYPYQTFGQANGRIKEISSTAVPQTALVVPGIPLPAHTANEPVYRVRVALEKQSISAYGSEVQLRPGATLEASIVVERRKIYQYLIDPLYRPATVL